MGKSEVEGGSGVLRAGLRMKQPLTKDALERVSMRSPQPRLFFPFPLTLQHHQGQTGWWIVIRTLGRLI